MGLCDLECRHGASSEDSLRLFGVSLLVEEHGDIGVGRLGH